MSLEEQLVRFYEDQPDEFLTSKDIAVKFSVGMKCVHSTLKRMQRNGYLLARPYRGATRAYVRQDGGQK